ncbi:hypothetical protein J8I87_20380 [Paraburkholderia sp. LEh10]|uniref:hypothetical protein n=1 Tax=Paraburkholderia sp. LEh10 TaxID=2821353 RepID=UPI001AEB9CD3|nr:hypothetical protein [Paraburkholderia sp. LEh10]MBP0592041.1 hypothetical protein [Paraburkholderia sp. LEh10]
MEIDKHRRSARERAALFISSFASRSASGTARRVRSIRWSRSSPLCAKASAYGLPVWVAATRLREQRLPQLVHVPSPVTRETENSQSNDSSAADTNLISNTTRDATALCRRTMLKLGFGAMAIGALGIQRAARAQAAATAMRAAAIR